MLFNIWLVLPLHLGLSHWGFFFFFEVFFFFLSYKVGTAKPTWPGIELKQLQLILGYTPKIHFHIQNFKHALFAYMGGEGGEKKVNSELRDLNSKIECCSQERETAKRHSAGFGEERVQNEGPSWKGAL